MQVTVALRLSTSVRTLVLVTTIVVSETMVPVAVMVGVERLMMFCAETETVKGKRRRWESLESIVSVMQRYLVDLLHRRVMCGETASKDSDDEVLYMLDMLDMLDMIYMLLWRAEAKLFGTCKSAFLIWPGHQRQLTLGFYLVS